MLTEDNNNQNSRQKISSLELIIKYKQDLDN